MSLLATESPLLAHARAQGWLGDRALPKGTDADLLGLLHHLARAGRLTRSELLTATLELYPKVAARRLALVWAEAALGDLRQIGSQGSDPTVGLDRPAHPAVLGAVQIVRQVLEGELGPGRLEVAEAVAREAEGFTRGAPFLVREPARMAIALAAPLPSVGAGEVALSAAAIAAHASGVRCGLYRPEEDMGGYSPDWGAREIFLDAALDQVKVAIAEVAA